MRYEIKALSLGGVLDQALAVTKNHFAVLLILTAIFVLPASLPVNLIQAVAQSKIQPATTLPEMMRNQQILQAEMAKYGPWMMILGLAQIILLPLSNGALVNAVANAYLGREVSVGGSIKAALARIFPLLWTWFVLGLVVMLGFLLLIIPGILFAFWYGLATQVAVIEKVSGPAALKRSKAVIKGHIGEYFVLSLVMGVLMIALSMGAAFVPQPHLSALAITLLQVASTILMSSIVVVFYFSCRCANENYDLQLLAQEVSDSANASSDDATDEDR